MKERITIAISVDLNRDISFMSLHQGRSKSNFIEVVLKDYIKSVKDIMEQAKLSHGDSSRADKTEV